MEKTKFYPQTTLNLVNTAQRCHMSYNAKGKEYHYLNYI